MASYSIRTATPGDISTLVRHRLQMFSDMGTPIDAPALSTAYEQWLQLLGL